CGARAALAEAAPELRPAQAEVVAEDEEQWSRRIDVHRVGGPVDLQRDGAHAPDGDAIRRAEQAPPLHACGRSVRVGRRAVVGSGFSRTLVRVFTSGFSRTFTGA